MRSSNSKQQILLLQQGIVKLLQGRHQRFDEYRAQREKLGVMVHDDEVHGSFRLGLLASLLVNQPEREFKLRYIHYVNKYVVCTSQCDVELC